MMPRVASLRAAPLAALASLVAVSGPIRNAEAQRSAWEGTVHVVQNSGWFTETISGHVHFEYDASSSTSTASEFVLTEGEIHWGFTPNETSCSVSGQEKTTAVSTADGEEWGRLTVFSDGTYVALAGNSQIPGVLHISCPDGLETDYNGLGVEILYVLTPLPLTGGGHVMSGSYSPNEGITTFTWHLTDLPAPELIVEIHEYDSWIPEGSRENASAPKSGYPEMKPGNDLVITAKLVNADGTPADVDAMSFRFELLACSREPGVAMNYPVPGEARNDYDLQFYPLRNPGEAEFDENGQSLTRLQGKEASAVLTSFDWGAFGALSVTADLDGRQIVGHLKGDASQTEILIPKRSTHSAIADEWKSKNNATGLADDDDTDDKPEGDGHVGDGFTLYEEYRGFLENGKHVRTSPADKDLFIRDEVGGRTKKGIALFAAASGIEVHSELRAEEFHSSRVMNANWDAGAHRVDQHGLRVVLGDEDFVSRVVNNDPAKPWPGLPRAIDRVQIGRWVIYGPSTFRAETGNQSVESGWEFVTAHELGHAVNVFHHGERDVTVKWTVQKDAGGIVARDEDGYPVVHESGGIEGEVGLFLESGQRFVPLWLQSAGTFDKVWIGLEHGQHSGDDTCLMRYNNSRAYPVTDYKRIVVRPHDVDQEGPAGSRFCASEIGTGVNAPGRVPYSRYGNADSDAPVVKQRGYCSHRICLNDAQPDH